MGHGGGLMACYGTRRKAKHIGYLVTKKLEQWTFGVEKRTIRVTTTTYAFSMYEAASGYGVRLR